ncbi:hypothetical protein COCSADRAFT_35975 [Bipolaris sorokiniana ND90Pr]|uniref:BTB domain-containing protein n=1 Tax=Cochliobolus sativus (strain ND90Pr / ATCC 201652) TaxID=665912 RepID=M2SFL9_COCSN|nr:uncharacterized protein COCSADRAFT_35975 [Bipolaris sorokiniana ND90Pr]EMD66038.1 hypothetical protein COCSADRAFT_35975 [Bipolaris sorokiniana ND90Pr]
MASTSQQQVLDSLKSFLASGAYSDLSIKCGRDTYRVHKVIVCGRAGFFARAIKFGGQEAQTDQIDLPEDDPKTVKLLIQYLYEGEYDPVLPPTTPQTTTLAVVTPVKHWDTASKSLSFPHTCHMIEFRGFDGPSIYDCSNDQLCPHHRCSIDCRYRCREFSCQTCVLPNPIGPSSQLLTHAKMYELADKYEVVGLKELSKEKFSRGCKHFWDTPAFPIAARHAFSTTPGKDNGLRCCVSQAVATNMQLIRKPEVRALLMQFNGLALGILDAKSKELGWA